MFLLTAKGVEHSRMRMSDEDIAAVDAVDVTIYQEIFYSVPPWTGDAIA
jgi:hypothetical protein